MKHPPTAGRIPVEPRNPRHGLSAGGRTIPPFDFDTGQTSTAGRIGTMDGSRDGITPIPSKPNPESSIV